MTTRWIGPDETLQPGDFGFLVEFTHPERADRWELRDTPPHTNQSRAPRLHGWCGSYNDLSTYGRGMARVERVARNGRALVRTLDGDELREALEELGYPELIPEAA